MYINRVIIRNFRSIVNETFEAKKLNIIVGTNDVGKSNFLKALNLFFNGETDINKPFRFEDDYSHNAKSGKGKAAEILVEIEFSPPSTYKGGKPVKWKKRWRKNGLQDNYEYKYIDGEAVSGRSKVGDWLFRLKYKYVPAIKSEKYFETLLCDLHDTLSETTEVELKEAGISFIAKIKENTSQITRELTKQIGFESSIDLPSDLKVLFASLDFQTQGSMRKISFRHRGDGIKVRHIPVILHFLAQQENRFLLSGATRVNTIWGFEEPENNLELQKCFDLADEFFNYSHEIQIFTTTHSPAFYSIADRDLENIRLFAVTQHIDAPTSKIELSNILNRSELNINMGLMPLVAPHILKIKNEKEQVEARLKTIEQEIEKFHKPVLFVEGNTDKNIFEDAIKEYGGDLYNKIIIESKSGAGYNWVKDRLHAWLLVGKDIRAAGIFDNDADAIKAKKEIDEIIGGKANKNIKSFRLSSPMHILEIGRKGIKIPFALEEVYPPFAWLHAEEKGWLEPRTDIIQYNNFNQLEIAFREFCDLKGLTADELLYLNKVKLFYKKDFQKYITSLKGIQRKDAIVGFENTVLDLKKFFEG